MERRHALQQKLQLLRCTHAHEWCATEHPFTVKHAAEIVVWLEDRVIRNDPIDARDGLRDFQDWRKWSKHFQAVRVLVLRADGYSRFVGSY